ncbi:MAG TPA: glycosyltransferase [Rhizobiaceae bacterium]|nr:glycosyltransferase [Rhizobiaceae bacterium]
MRIALGIYRLQPRGGLEDNCIRIAEELARRGHEPTVVLAGPHADLPFPIKTVSLAPGAFSSHARLGAFSRAFSQATRERFERTVAFQLMPDADILFIADALRDNPGAPLVKRLTPRFQAFARLERACFGPDAKIRIIGQALPQMKAFVDRYPASRERIAVIPPAIAAARHRPELRERLRARTRKALGLNELAQTWLWLGLQPEIKGLDRVIETLPEHPETSLLIGGLTATDPKMRKHLARARQLGVDGRIHCLGYVSGDKFFEVLAAADALAHPARTEIAGAVIIEALANGLPVVTTDICGFAEHVEKSGAGRVVHGPFDRSSFSRYLGEVCGAANASLSKLGIAYGADPKLYSGIGAACDLIEAESWSPRCDV